MEKKIVVAFDFDGTITTKDTLLEFIRFSKGAMAFFLGFLLHTPYLILFKLGLYQNWKIKQRLFGYFFKGMDYKDFVKVGQDFEPILEKMIRPKALKAIRSYSEKGIPVYIISASVSEWISPWAIKEGVNHIIGTKVEISSNGKLTGNFLSRNCYGEEKVRRLLELEPNRNSYILYAYGDSKGDKELIEFADKGWYNKFK